MLHLQRTAGNQAAQRAVQRMISASPVSKLASAAPRREDEASIHEVAAKPAAISKPHIPTRNASVVHPAGPQAGAPVSVESPGMGGAGEDGGGSATAGPPPGNNNGQPQLPPSLRRFFDSRQDHDLGGARVYQDKPATRPMENYAPLTVNEPGDRFEREADMVAEYVMRTPAAAFNGAGKNLSSCYDGSKLQRQRSERTPQIFVQRKCSQCEEEEQKNILQRQVSKDATQGFHGSAQVFAVRGRRTQTETAAAGRGRRAGSSAADCPSGTEFAGQAAGWRDAQLHGTAIRARFQRCAYPYRCTGRRVGAIGECAGLHSGARYCARCGAVCAHSSGRAEAAGA